MAEYVVQDTSLTAIADAIREKAGLADSFVFPEGFVQAISGIEAGGGKLYYGSMTPTENTFTCKMDCDMTEMKDGQNILPTVAIVCDSDLTTISYTSNLSHEVCGAGIQINTEEIDLTAIYSFKGHRDATWGVYDVATRRVARAINGYLFFYANEVIDSSNKAYIAGRTYHFIALFS